MAREYELFMAMVPPTITHQEHKVAVVNCKPVFYEPQDLKQAKSKLMAHLAQHVPDKRMDRAVMLVVKWLFPKGKHKNGEYRTTKPDTDNLQKMLKDCMTKLNYWKDDCLVVSEHVEKFWADKPGIYIMIREME